MIMSENSDVWYGYLEAGEKSSPVLIDPKLDTGNSKTLYMYNLNSQRIIEYKREIAEPKLRGLKDPEKDMVKDLMKGYESARKEFTPRAKGTGALPASAPLTTGKARPKVNQFEPPADSMDDFDVDDSEDIELDDDLDEESESDSDSED